MSYFANNSHKQRGIVLVFTLIALLAMALAAVALIRSVDKNVLMTGNLALKQSATSAGDAGTEAAIDWLTSVEKNNLDINVLNDKSHPLNKTGGTGSFINSGYYSNIDTAISLTNGLDMAWDNTDSMLVNTPHPTNNAIRYIIQRMCRNKNVAVKDAQCLFSSATEDFNGSHSALPQDECHGAGCPFAGQVAQMRITSRITSPKNIVSYIQAFVYIEVVQDADPIHVFEDKDYHSSSLGFIPKRMLLRELAP